jgi:hypothetical protein
MESIILQALLVPPELSSDGSSSDHISVTTYGLCGQGSGLKGARDSAISVISCYLDYYAQNNCELPLPEQQLSNAQEITDYFNADDPWLVERRKKREARKYVLGQTVTSLKGIKDNLYQKKLTELSFRNDGLGNLVRYLLNRSDKRLDLPERTYIIKDEIISVPAKGNVPELVFEFYRLEKKGLRLV